MGPYIHERRPETNEESSRLPAHARRFIPMFWLYWPKEKDRSIIDTTWKPPAVKMLQ